MLTFYKQVIKTSPKTRQNGISKNDVANYLTQARQKCFPVPNLQE